MSAVFISYRRDDSAGHTGRLYDHLYEKLGKEYVFMDIDTIEPGMDFVKAIDKEIKGCSVLIVVIGDEWLTASDENGRRLDDPNDFIHIEIGAALRRDLRIIPVLVKGAKMPSANELPDDIAALSRRHALELSDSRWNYDIKRLLTTLATSLEKADNEKEELINQDNKPLVQAGDKRATVVTEKNIPFKNNGKNNFLRYLIPVVGIGLIASLLIIFWQPEPVDNENTKEIINAESNGKVTEPGTSTTTDTRLKESLTPTTQAEAGDTYTEDSNISRDRVFEETLKSANETRIDELTISAAQDVRAFRLTSPAGNNAVEKYNEILEMEPGHPTAVKGIETVAEKYVAMARSALKKGQLEKADKHLIQARRLLPEMDGLKVLQERIIVEKRRLEFERQQANVSRRNAELEEQKAREIDAERQALQIQVRHKACLKDCKNKFQVCQDKQQPTSNDCDSKVKVECEKEREACLNDPQVYILWGEFGADAECNGRWQQCIDKQTQRCKEQASPAISDCEPAFTSCKNSCR